jgi:hypothetical protein
VLASAPVELVARSTTMLLWPGPTPYGVTETLSGELATPGFRNCARMLLPPLWPWSFASR